MKNRLKELEQKIGYTFQDFSLLEQAMMHSSYTNEKHLPSLPVLAGRLFLAARYLSWDHKAGRRGGQRLRMDGGLKYPLKVPV